MEAIPGNLVPSNGSEKENSRNRCVQYVTSPRNNEHYTSLTKMKLTEKRLRLSKQQSQAAMMISLGVVRAPPYTSLEATGKQVSAAQGPVAPAPAQESAAANDNTGFEQQH